MKSIFPRERSIGPQYARPTAKLTSSNGGLAVKTGNAENAVVDIRILFRSPYKRRVPLMSQASFLVQDGGSHLMFSTSPETIARNNLEMTARVLVEVAPHRTFYVLVTNFSIRHIMLLKWMLVARRVPVPVQVMKVPILAQALPVTRPILTQSTPYSTNRLCHGMFTSSRQVMCPQRMKNDWRRLGVPTQFRQYKQPMFEHAGTVSPM